MSYTHKITKLQKYIHQNAYCTSKRVCVCVLASGLIRNTEAPPTSDHIIFITFSSLHLSFVGRPKRTNYKNQKMIPFQ